MVDLNLRASRLSAGTRALLLRTASVAALMAIINPTPAFAQLAARRGPTATAPAIAPSAVPGQIRSRGATEALDRSIAVKTRVDDIQRYVKQARAAAVSSVTPDGLQGLVIARSITNEALVAGALQAARDSTGRVTWQGAALPVETVADGKNLVTITQNESRAILSWDRFDVGSNTTLQFNQNNNKDWVAVNRVVDPNASPSHILGSIKADGTVVVLNRNGVMFGNGAQVSVNSLLASSLELGNFAKAVSVTRINDFGQSSFNQELLGLSVSERNINFLQNGLLQPSVAIGVQTLAPNLVSDEYTGSYLPADLQSAFNGAPTGAVTVERGANITAGKGGFVILAAPTVSNDGALSAAEGQVSLQAGRAISVTPSTGAEILGTDAERALILRTTDPLIRGLILRTTYGSASDLATNSGFIETARGYASLGSGLTGGVTNAGLIAATTSVSRNGSISLTGGVIALSGSSIQGEASGLVITPDENGETVPQGSSAEPVNFKTSRIQIGGVYIDPLNGVLDPLGDLGPSGISIDENALIYAPSADVQIGGKAGDTFFASRFGNLSIPNGVATLAASKIDIAKGVLIDVGGVKDLVLDASRNSLLIDPIKRNELRDTPVYREINTTGDFTLNGAAVYVDPRISGVRDDGVKYVGSPLIEAGSAASQIAVSAAELMTKGGNITLDVAVLEVAAPLATTPKITIARDAVLDFEGGWVRYSDGIVRTSRLLTSDGRIVDIGQANPNDDFVAIGDGFTDVQAKFGISRTYTNTILQGGRFEYGYDEGRDAGSLIISASTAILDGNFRGSAFAGSRQIQNGALPSGANSISGDLRKLQAGSGEIPSGGYLRIGAFGKTALTGDIVIGNAQTVAPMGAILLNVSALSSAGLSALSLKTSAGITVEQGSNLILANGGAFDAEAGRNIRLDGNISVPSGTINAKTTDFGRDGDRSIGSLGSPFRDNDNLASFYISDPELTPFDITVEGTLSAAGLWVNDFLSENLVGNAWNDGGAISLTVAPRVIVGLGASAGKLTSAVDLSGSIRIARTALLDVSSGGYVGSDGSLDLSAKGGDIALINQTLYASTSLTDTDIGNTSSATQPLGGRNQTVTFTPYKVGEANIVPSLVPGRVISEVSFDAGSIKGFGFGGGGTFRLVAPDIAMGSAIGGKGPSIGLDFLARTGFATLDLTANKSRILSGLFNNGNAGNSAFLDTEIFRIGAGETLDLTQTVLPSLLDIATVTQLTNLASGANINTILTPAIPQDAWDRKAANLKLGGLTELDVESGGSIVGAAGASISVPRLYSAGTIKIAGGRITQTDTLASILQSASNASRILGVKDQALGGGGLSDVLGGGVAGQNAGFDEKALARIDAYPNISGVQQLTNGQLFSLVDPFNAVNDDVALVFTGRVALNEGIHLTGASITDLSGIALYNPRAPFLANGTQQRLGHIIGGGLLSTSAFSGELSQTGFASPIDPGNILNAEASARINLSGASGHFDERISQTSYGLVSQWSDAGQLLIGSGALLTGATVTAFGGDDGDLDLTKTRANGGVLEWSAPVIRQSDDGSVNSGSSLFAQQIMDAGFQSLVVRGGFTTAGDVNLNLGKSFIATTADRNGAKSPTTALLINSATGSNAAINSAYIRLESGAQEIASQGSSTGVGHIKFGGKAIDIVGAVHVNVSAQTNGVNRGSASFEAVGDIRFVGVAPPPKTDVITTGLSGQLVTNGDLFFKAAQVYATTGTGDLQELIENRRAGKAETPNPFVVASTNIGGLMKFEGQAAAAPETPYSAGSYLRILGANIEQNGVLRAPLGLLEIGANQASAINGNTNAPATLSLKFGADSLTSVSARTSLDNDQALNIPYGTTTDTIEYFFSPGTNAVITAAPVGELRLAGKDISIESDAAGEVRVDARGGGDVFAFEFIPGTGGSRDVLDRFNPDVFSGNDGLQFADGRQVYAILPKNSAAVAMFDPIYSADYGIGTGGDLYGANAGRSVTLDAAPGIDAGEYILLPARYALLPGALRIVENTGSFAPTTGATTTLLDGSILVGGVYSTAGAGFEQSQRRSFTVQTKDVFSKYSQIAVTSGTTSAIKLAEHSRAVVAPLLPRDAARVVLSPLTTLKVSGAFATAPAAGGLGAQVDIGGTKIRVASAGATAEAATQDYVLLTTDTLSNFNANSLSIGALRNNNANGTTRLDVVTSTLLVDNDVKFSAPELLLAVGGQGSLLTIEDAPKGKTGAVLTATGILNDKRTGDYIVNATGLAGSSVGVIDPTGSGALIRLANGPERLVTREGDFVLRNTTLPARLDIGVGATLGASAITLDTSRTFAIDKTAQIGAASGGNEFTLALSADTMRIGGLTFAPQIEAQFGLASRLTLRSPDIINFNPGAYQYKDLTIDAAGIGLAQPIPLTAQTSDVKLVADHVVLRNSSKDIGACKDVGARLCGAFSTLTIDATDITFGSGQFRTSGFDAGISGSGVTLSAREGMYVTGAGGFSTANFDENLETPINFITPFIVDRSYVDDPRNSYTRPDYSFGTVGAITVKNSENSAAITTGPQAPGAHISFAAGNTFNAIASDITIDGSVIRATAGTVDVKATGSIFVNGNASIQAPGYTRTFDDGIDEVVVSANGGAINLISTGGGTLIDVAATSSLIVDNGIGKAGTLNIAASEGSVSLLAKLNLGLAANTQRSSSFFLDAGQAEFALGQFASNYGSLFQGDIAIRTGTGNLDLSAGQKIVADSVSLTADGGLVSIAGLIDTTGDNVDDIALTDQRYKDARIDGGNISLFGRNGVTLATSASLIATTSGYGKQDARQASGGNVTIGVGIAELPGQASSLYIAEGATINVGATRPGNRLITEFITGVGNTESTVFRQALGDQGGLVSFRNPLLLDNSINFSNKGQIKGAREVSIEAHRRFDLDAISNSDIFSGVGLRPSFPADVTTLDASEIKVGKANFLADIAPGTLPDFVRNFTVTGLNGEALDSYRLRPGVELNSVNDIRLLSNLNLAAGQIVNADGTPGYRDAVAAGLMVESPLGRYTSGPLAGQMRYETVFGKEAELYERFVDMTYRVDGNVRGEAPVVTFRSQGNLEIRNSISDGFFAFHDLSSADYISYQLGGGDHTYNPALNISCGIGDAAYCGDSELFSNVLLSRIAGLPATRVTIQIGAAQQGADSQPYVNAPYNPLANAVASGGTGDPLGVAELFPLFTDGSSAHSSNINFVGGAANSSANPLQINLSRSGSVTISGETSYQIKAVAGTGRIAGPLQLAYNGPEIGTADRVLYSLDELLSLIDSGNDPEFGLDYYTVLNWGIGATGAAADARTRALAYAAFKGSNRFLGSLSNPTGVQARLRDVIAFLKDSGFAEAFSRGVEQKLPGFNTVANIIPKLADQSALNQTPNNSSDTAFVGTKVRTGDGSINIAAANNIDLRRSVGLVSRKSSENILEQVGGTAVYTAGVRAATSDFSNAILPGERTVAQGSSDSVPSPFRAVKQTSVYTKNGGNILLTAGNDVFGRRNVWNEASVISAQGSIDIYAAILPNKFISGVGALSGGDVTIKAGRDVSDLTIALNTSLVTGAANGKRTLVKLGGGDLTLSAGRNLNGGEFDIASGAAFAKIGGNVDAAGTTSSMGSFVGDNRNLLRVRVADGTFDLVANGSVTIGSLGSLGIIDSQKGFFSSIAGAWLEGTGDVAIVGNRPQALGATATNFVLPPSLSLTSLNSDIVFGNGSNLFPSNVLYASEYGQLSLLAGGDITNFAIAMSDAAPSHFLGGDDALTTLFPVVRSNTSDAGLRALHNRRITHFNDPEPVRIFAAGSISKADIILPKQARITAGGDITNLYFQGQNVRPNDVTRITAGGDIIGTTSVGVNGKSTALGNSIIVGGPGTLFVEAGRDLGPFITSSEFEAGGIRTIGNEFNPWLSPQGADIYAFFGVGKGMRYDALQSTYLDPANLAQLDGDLFEQNEDSFGNKSPDRTRYSYAPKLAEWLSDNYPELFTSVFGTTPPSTETIYGRYADVYNAFASLDQHTRNRFLIDKLYFGELAAASDPAGESFNQFIRGYRAVEALFPASLGYTDNLSTYQTDTGTINADHPLGVPTKILVDGQPLVATKVETGNVDLRLSTIQTARGGDVTILGPGGNFIAGSVVRTEAQLARRNTIIRGTGSLIPSELTQLVRPIKSIPLGSEGILTLRGGEIRGFTDGSFVLNQSRLFTQRGGDITLWSSNGDLNAGQGPKSSSNFPPITLKFNPNASSEVDSAGSVSGAGIAAFRPSPEIEPSSVRLIAPVGTVDAGDAGVRASGDVFVAAAQVANADNFAAGGSVVGVPSIGSVAAPAVPASAASAIVANAFRAADAIGKGADRLSRIFVDVLGYFGGGDKCSDGQAPDASGACKVE
jgi:filamentous hemagglutinin family protein